MSVSRNAMSACIAATLAAFAAAPAQALTMQECSLKYKSAQSAGALKGMTWNQFRKAECGPGAALAASGSATTTSAAGTARGSSIGGALFPSSISPKYASEKPGKARMHTCLDQYKANKAANRTGGLKWIAKGGGYYSECNKRLGGR